MSRVVFSKNQNRKFPLQRSIGNPALSRPHFGLRGPLTEDLFLPRRIVLDSVVQRRFLAPDQTHATAADSTPLRIAPNAPISALFIPILELDLQGRDTAMKFPLLPAGVVVGVLVFLVDPFGTTVVLLLGGLFLAQLLHRR